MIFRLSMYRAYSRGLLKSVLFQSHYNDDNEYPTFEQMAKHLNKTSHKVSFLAIRSNTGSTTFHTQAPTADMQHSFGVPRYFFRFNLTSAICNQPYSHVHWAMFKLRMCHRASFEGTMTRQEWTTGPSVRQGISPFCYIEDCIPSRFALGNSELLCLVISIILNSTNLYIML